MKKKHDEIGNKRKLTNIKHYTNINKNSNLTNILQFYQLKYKTEHWNKFKQLSTRKHINQNDSIEILEKYINQI